MKSGKGKANVVYVVHDVVKKERGNLPSGGNRNEKMKKLPMVQCFWRILYELNQSLPDEIRHSVRENLNDFSIYDIGAYLSMCMCY